MEKKEENAQEASKRQEKPDWDIRPYLAIALTCFLVFCLCMVVFFVFFRYESFRKNLDTIVSVLQPITMGLIIAYLIHPIMKFYEDMLYRLTREEKRIGQPRRWIRNVSTIGL